MLLADFNESGFYASQYSSTERKFWAYNNRLKQHIRYFKQSPITRTFSLNNEISRLDEQLEIYNNTYNELIYLYKLKGFKNYGLEGKMREYAHSIYDFNNNDIKLYCLMLRRHEKDFLLRKDLIYVYQFSSISIKFVDVINKNPSIEPKQKKYLIQQLYYYNKFFRQLSRIESRIGIKGKSGFLNKSKEMFDKLAQKIEFLDATLTKNIDLHEEKLKQNTLILSTVLIAFLIAAIFILSYSMTYSVKTISNSFTTYINSGFDNNSVKYHKTRIKEFNNIYLSFLKMTKEINIFTNFFKEKVLERTLAINQQKEEIQAQQIKIETQYSVLLTKSNELLEQKNC